MTMWKVTVCPDENANAWQSFLDEGIIAIGYPGSEEKQVVKKFSSIQEGDLVVAHLSSKRNHVTKTAAGVGRVMGEYRVVKDLPANVWSDGPRRQLDVQWLATRDIKLEIVLGCRSVYGPTVVKLSDELAAQVLAAYGLDR